MHSERILIFEPENSKLRKAGVGAYGNVLVSVKRRVNNVLVDKEKQQIIDVRCAGHGAGAMPCLAMRLLWPSPLLPTTA